jgi:hypothetical protein
MFENGIIDWLNYLLCRRIGLGASRRPCELLNPLL